MTQICFFCHTQAGMGYVRDNFQVNVGELWQTPNFYVMPMIGGGVPGYLLVFSKRHYHSMADMPHRNLRELKEVLAVIRSSLGKGFGRSIIFEHGSTCNNISCMIDHAHMHIVPVPDGFSVLEEIERDYSVNRLDNFDDLRCWCSGGLGNSIFKMNGKGEEEIEAEYEEFVGYLFFMEQNGDMFISQLATVEGFQSQYLRKVLLTKLGLREWNWERLVDQEAIDETRSKLIGLKEALVRIK